MLWLMTNGGLTQVLPPFVISQSIVSQWWHRRHLHDPGHRWLRQIFASSGA